MKQNLLNKLNIRERSNEELLYILEQKLYDIQNTHGKLLNNILEKLSEQKNQIQNPI